MLCCCQIQAEINIPGKVTQRKAATPPRLTTSQANTQAARKESLNAMLSEMLHSQAKGRDDSTYRPGLPGRTPWELAGILSKDPPLPYSSHSQKPHLNPAGIWGQGLLWLQTLQPALMYRVDRSRTPTLKCTEVWLLLLLSHVSDSATPWVIACQAALSMAFSRQEYWSGLPFPTPGDLLHQGIKSESSVSPALADRDSLPLCHLGSPRIVLGAA